MVADMAAVAASSEGQRERLTSYALLWRLPMPIWQIAFFVIPLLFLIAVSFFIVKNYRVEPGFLPENWTKILGRYIFWKTYGYTFLLATIATIVGTVLAFPAAYALAFKLSESARRWAVFLLIIPFFTSYVVRIFAWMFLLAREGVVNGALGRLGLGPWTMLNTPIGTMVGYMTLTLPLVIILQTFALAGIDQRYVEAAHNLGCGRLRAVFTVVIPLAKVGLVIAALFCFILSFGDFVAPYYLGGSTPPTLPIMIVDQTKSGQQWPRASVIALTMITTLFVIAFLFVTAAYRRRT
jgi:ABC-type spermidine/putrescine transport system permease subunit I